MNFYQDQEQAMNEQSKASKLISDYIEASMSKNNAKSDLCIQDSIELLERIDPKDCSDDVYESIDCVIADLKWALSWMRD